MLFNLNLHPFPYSFYSSEWEPSSRNDIKSLKSKNTKNNNDATVNKALEFDLVLVFLADLNILRGLKYPTNTKDSMQIFVDDCWLVLQFNSTEEEDCK